MPSMGPSLLLCLSKLVKWSALQVLWASVVARVAPEEKSEPTGSWMLLQDGFLDIFLTSKLDRSLCSSLDSDFGSQVASDFDSFSSRSI